MRIGRQSDGPGAAILCVSSPMRKRRRWFVALGQGILNPHLAAARLSAGD
jgi:hypothetical protein